MRKKKEDDFAKYEGDAFYEAWRSGRDPDALDVEELINSYYDGISPEAAASHQYERADRRRAEEEALYEEQDED